MTVENSKDKDQIPNSIPIAIGTNSQNHMPRILLIVFSLFLVFSCKQRSDYSGDHLSKEVMQKVLQDVNFAEAYSISVKDSLHKAGSKNVDSLTAFYSRIFAHYKITEQEFNNSMEWYKNHPEELDTVYSRIIPVVNKLQAQLPPTKTPVPVPIAPPLPAPNPPPAQNGAQPAARPSLLHPNGIKGNPHKAKVPADNANSN